MAGGASAPGALDPPSPAYRSPTGSPEAVFMDFQPFLRWRDYIEQGSRTYFLDAGHSRVFLEKN